MTFSLAAGSADQGFVSRRFLFKVFKYLKISAAGLADDHFVGRVFGLGFCLSNIRILNIQILIFDSNIFDGRACG